MYTCVRNFTFSIPCIMIKLLQYKPTISTYFLILTIMFNVHKLLHVSVPTGQSSGSAQSVNPLTPNGLYISRTAPLTSKRCILYIYSTNIGTEYFKHALYSPFFFLQNAVCFIMLSCLVPVLFTFYIRGVLKLKKNNSGAKGLKQLIAVGKETLLGINLV
jgi:hypothetical protein